MAKKDKRTNNELQSTIRKTKDWEIKAKLTENRSELTCFGKVRSSWYSSDTRLWYTILNLDIWSDTCYHTMLCMFSFIYLHLRNKSNSLVDFTGVIMWQVVCLRIQMIGITHHRIKPKVIYFKELKLSL